MLGWVGSWKTGLGNICCDDRSEIWKRDLELAIFMTGAMVRLGTVYSQICSANFEYNNKEL